MTSVPTTLPSNNIPIIVITANYLTGTTPLTVQFTGTSTNTPTSWNWDFGDGNKVNTIGNTVTNTYNNPGTFNVNVTATNASGVSAPATKIIIVTPSNNGTITDAKFTSTPLTGNAPLTVSFKDLSTGGPIAWEWNFGDGSEISKLQNPEHIYQNPGTYTVTLLTTNPGGSNKTKTETIIVTESILTTIYNTVMGNPMLSGAGAVCCCICIILIILCIVFMNK